MCSIITEKRFKRFKRFIKKIMYLFNHPKEEQTNSCVVTCLKRKSKLQRRVQNNSKGNKKHTYLSRNNTENQARSRSIKGKVLALVRRSTFCLVFSHF